MSRIIIFFLAIIALVKADFRLPLERELHDETHVITNRNALFESVYRLPTSVVPLEYDIYIDLYFDENVDRPFSYDGREDIVIQAVEGVTHIILHSNVDRINSISVLSNTGTPVHLNAWEPWTLEPQYHFLKVNLAQTLELNVNYTLHIEYSSTMNEGPMKRGIWRGWYEDDNGVERIYATTHFQPYNARQAFPCWDEPYFKAVFRMHLSRPSGYIGRFSNTVLQSVDVLSNNRARDNFMPTPKMSSYLVTFLVSESFQVIAQNTTFEPPIRIIGRSNTAGQGDHALDLAVKMTEFFNDYFQYPYEELHPNLLNDHVSSPDWASAGTENWGMVSYRELNLIIDKSKTLMSVEHYAATLVSHELAHKWFGNLITCFWWSNTWINEGFASYFGYIATHEKFPQYDFHEHFNNRYLQTSLSYDSGMSSEPMNDVVNTPAQVTGHFGTISYSKGAAFLRMTANMITPATFRKACQYFLRDNAFEPTAPVHLYAAFRRAVDEDRTLDEYLNFNFTDYYDIWVNEPGYPLLTVDIDYDTGIMALSQERFYLNPDATPSNQIYPIPITYSTNSQQNFDSLKPIYMMTTDRIVLDKSPGEEWVVFNNLQHGHYRVNYNDRNWQLLSEALLNDPDSIHDLNRAQIVDDVFALMRSEKMTYAYGFNILRFLRNEVNYHVWDPAISGFTWLRNRLRHLPEEQEEFDEYVLSLLQHAIESVGFDPIQDETPTFTMTRQVILHFACLLGHSGCVEESKNRFQTSFSTITPGIRRNVLVVGVREGGIAEFDRVWQLFEESNLANDKLEFLRALGATRDAELLTRYLELTLEKEVRSHDKVNSFNYALLGNQRNAPTVLQFVIENINRIRIEYVEDSPANPVQSVLSNLATYLDLSDLEVYENWMQATQSNFNQFNATIRAINSARTNIAWGDENANIIIDAARGGAVKVVTSLIMLLALSALTVVVK